MNSKTLLSSLTISSNDEVSQESLTSSINPKSLLNKFDFELIEDYTQPSLTKIDREIILSEINSRNKLLILELINTLNLKYTFSNSSFVKSLLLEVLDSSIISFPLKIQIIQTFSNNPKLSENCFYQYISLLKNVVYKSIDFKKEFEVSNTIIFDTYKTILKTIPEIISENSSTDIINLGKNILCDTSLEEEFRYRLLQSIYKDSVIPSMYKLKLITMFLLNNQFSEYRYYIYICQILNNIENGLTKDILDYVCETLSKFSLDNNGIADIADFLLSLDDCYEVKEKAQKMLDSVSFDKKSLKTFYNNAQNIHQVNVEESINPFIEKLVELQDVEIKLNGTTYKTIPTMDDTVEYGTFLEDLISQLETIASSFNFDSSQIKRIKSSITRFIFDNTIYSDYCVSLLQILIKSYQYIEMHEYKEELLLRMCEELVDMSDTCTTGHIYRIVNIFSGYDVEIKIPIEEEVKSCIFARLQKIISEKSDEVQEMIFEHIGSSDEIRNRKKEKIKTMTMNDLGKDEEFIIEDELLQKEEDPEVVFTRLLGKDILSIFEELKNEYVKQQLLDEQTLDMYMRRAITSFQLGERI